MPDVFRRFSHRVSEAVGSSQTFVLALLVIAAWAITGPLYRWSDTWQLVINTGTTIVTFLMVFLIQNTQNRDATAIHLKLDELIRAVKGARTELVDLEEFSDEELKLLQREFRELHQRLNARGGHEAGHAARASRKLHDDIGVALESRRGGHPGRHREQE